MDTERNEFDVTGPGSAPMAPATAAMKPRGPLSGGLGVIVALIVLGCAGYLFWNYWSGLANTPAEAARDVERQFLCAETHKLFPYALREGESPPVMSPYTKKKTGYPFECCYYNKDGTTKDTPTYVILNHYLGKPGDTICPDCGKVVVGHNPDPRKRGPQPASAPGAPTPRR